MKGLKFAGVLVALLVAGAPAHADAVTGATTSGSASLEIYAPIAVKQTQGLEFGAVTAAAAGSVTVDAGSGARTSAGGVSVLAPANPQKTPRQATFTITGQSNAAITVTVGAAITGFAGGITGVTLPAVLPTALSGDSATFTVGGTLRIPAAVPIGLYSGAYTVAVNYP